MHYVIRVKVGYAVNQLPKDDTTELLRQSHVLLLLNVVVETLAVAHLHDKVDIHAGVYYLE